MTISSTRKKKAGQAGCADTHPYLREERVQIRVSAHEKKRIEQLSVERGFDTTAQYVRSQAIYPGKENPSAQRQAQLACMHQLNRLGTNVNQIAKHLNSGASPDSDMLDAVLQILAEAQLLVARATDGGGA